MKRFLAFLCVASLFCACFAGCGNSSKSIKIGVSMGVGAAERWAKEQKYMEEHAAELGVPIEVRLNRGDGEKTQQEDCMELIDSGVDVLIYTPRDATKAKEVLAYAKSKNVPVINYARVVLGEPVDLFVGYDSSRIGQQQGQYLAELVYEGDYIILRGDPDDNNATLLYEGTMRYIDPIKENIHILLDAPVPGWDPATAKTMVEEAVAANGGTVDAILAPNDKLAGACAEALAELGVTQHVVITGMDAELDAVQRIVAGTQDSTLYMDLQVLAETAVEEAAKMARGEKVDVNADFDNQSGGTIDANLITGQLVTRENLDAILIDSGHFTKEEVYGGAASLGASSPSSASSGASASSNTAVSSASPVSSSGAGLAGSVSLASSAA